MAKLKLAGLLLAGLIAAALIATALIAIGLSRWQIDRTDPPTQTAIPFAVTTVTNDNTNVASRARLPEASSISSIIAPTNTTNTSPPLAIHDAATSLGPLSSSQLEWLAAHGYQDLPDGTDIADAERQRLHAEAVSGATAAIHRYAAVAAIRGDADAITWLHRSATQGSTQALLRIALWHSREDTTAQATDSAMAWLLVAQRRGDPFAHDLMVSISDRDITPAIEQQADALYRDLESDRYRHGLPAFDHQSFPTSASTSTP